ncbi:hypothetical protein [Subtercola lobariae]|uniref:hypothetical protein n=1 Tax=Subtercola lobariae TaxID=1588641 RepID=UPI0016628F05|nr:hypothetical protein [Subtercola lobariae]
MARVDDQPESIGSAGTTPASVLSLAGFATTFSNVDIAKVAYYPFALTFSQRNAVVTGLRATYGI